MDVFPVRGKDRPSTDKTPHYRERRFQDRQPERHHRNRDGNDGGRLLRALQRQRAQHETDEKASAISQEDRGGIEIESKESQHRSSKCNREKGDQRRTA